MQKIKIAITLVLILNLNNVAGIDGNSYNFNVIIANTDIYDDQDLELTIFTQEYSKVNITIFNLNEVGYSNIHDLEVGVNNDIVIPNSNTLYEVMQIELTPVGLNTDTVSEILDFITFKSVNESTGLIILSTAKDEYDAGEVVVVAIGSNDEGIEDVIIEIYDEEKLIDEYTQNINVLSNFYYEISDYISRRTTLDINVYYANNRNINNTVSITITGALSDNEYSPVNVIVIIGYEARALSRTHEYNVTIVNYTDYNESVTYDCSSTVCRYTINEFNEFELLRARKSDHIGVLVNNVEQTTYSGYWNFYYHSFNNTIKVTLVNHIDNTDLIATGVVIVVLLIAILGVNYKFNKKKVNKDVSIRLSESSK